jgi:hypothetical protein
VPPASSLPAPLRLLVAAGPSVPGVVECLAEAERTGRAGGDAHVLLTEDGLEILEGPWPARLEAARVATSICTRSARARRTKPERVPACARWSSLTTFLGAMPSGARLWTAFP